MSVVVAILVYALLGWGLGRLVAIIFFRNITVAQRSRPWVRNGHPLPP
jgi:hypothetical protein